MALRPTSDLGSLMQSALEEYNQTTRDLRKDYDQSMEARSIADVEAYVVDHMDKFKKFRHDGSKLDIVRTAIGNNLGQIQVMSDVLAGPTTAAFPAATPIFTAINFLVFTGNRVRSDFDNLLNFLEEVGSCMNSISIVEGFVHTGRQIPQLDVDFKNVFGAVLSLCGISTKYISDGRFKRGLMRGVLGDDGGLSSAYGRLQKSMVALGRSIQNGTFAGVVVLTEGMAELEDQVAELDRLSRETNQVAKDTKDIVKETKDDIKDLRDAFKDQNMSETRRIRIFFEGFATWEAPFEERKRKFVDGTSEWLLKEDDIYKTWFGEGDKSSWGRGRLSALWIWGGTGTGKSILAFKTVDTLKSYAAEFRGVSVIYYFFPTERKVSLKSALKSLIIQIADFDELYSKRIASLIKNSNQSKAEDVDTMTIWKTYVADQYVSGSARGKLHIVLDNIEELSAADQKVLQDIVGQIISDKLLIKILLFGQSEINDKFEKIGDIQLPHIEVTPGRIGPAIKSFIADRVSKFQISLDDSLKTEIIDSLSRDAGGFAFVDACLDEIEATDQVEDIPDVLTSLPSTYKDLLKRGIGRILNEIQSKKNQGDRLKAIKILLYWTALAQRYLRVKELKCVIAMKTKYSNFNVVGEVKKTCAGLLWIPTDDEDTEEGPNTESKGDVHDAANSSDHKSAHATDSDMLMDNFARFREFRFEDCFQDVEWTSEVDRPLIEDATVAQFQLAITTLQVLSCAATDPLYEASRNLEEYSASHWHEHVANVDFQYATDEQVSQIMKGLKAIFTTPETTSVALERQKMRMYDDFLSSLPMENVEEKDFDEIGVVRKWCVHAKRIGQERLKLSAEEFAWIEGVLSHAPSLLKSLAEEHIKHWFKVVDISKAYETFGFALSALHATGEIPRPDDSAPLTESDIILVSQKCLDYPMDEDAYRAIAATLTEYDFSKKSVEYYLKAEACSKTSSGKFFTLVGLGCAYRAVGEFEKAYEVLSRALLLEEEMKSLKQHENYVNYLLRRAYETIGTAVWNMNDRPLPKEEIEKAIRAFERASTFHSTADLSTDEMIMDWTASVLIGSEDMKGFVERVLSWDAKPCAAWMLEDIEYGGRHHIEFQNAAKQEHRIHDMIACYKAAMEAITDEGDALLIRVEFASMFWKALEDEDLAHDELSQIMDSTDPSKHGIRARHRANLLLSEMMYGRIKLAPTVWMKRILAKNLATFSEKDTENEQDIWNIRPNISLASAYLSSNQLQEAAKLLDHTFSMCMDLLRDDVSWNDSTSLRLLAKLLACAGLQRDAMIAYSAGFSSLDAPSDEKDPDAKSPTEDVAAQTDFGDKSGTSEEDNSQKDTPGDSQSEAQEGEKQPAEDKGQDATSEKDGSKDKTEGDTVEIAHPKLQRLIPEGQEELTSTTGGWTCDGCSKEFSYWAIDEPLYLCLICRDIDLCKDCHAKRLKANEEGSNTRVAYCGMNHDYVKGPIEGWGGIKEGIMTVLPEKINFHHWLTDLEERWVEWKAPPSSEELLRRKVEEVERAIKHSELDS